eukprot:m.13834 g.13834  ORF g.13834 m.13834 type:complete len:187 (+) comp4205_c1_seq1:125-685(+)
MISFSFLQSWWAGAVGFGGSLVCLGLFYAMEQIYLNGEEMLDTSFEYSALEAKARFQTYGEVGRHVYALASLTVDVAFPLFYGLLSFYWVNMVSKSISIWKQGVYFPFAIAQLVLTVLVMLLDVLENILLVRLLVGFPNITDQQIETASSLTKLKWYTARGIGITSSISFVFLALKLIVYKRAKEL